MSLPFGLGASNLKIATIPNRQLVFINSVSMNVDVEASLNILTNSVVQKGIEATLRIKGEDPIEIGWLDYHFRKSNYAMYSTLVKDLLKYGFCLVAYESITGGTRGQVTLDGSIMDIEKLNTPMTMFTDDLLENSSDEGEIDENSDDEELAEKIAEGSSPKEPTDPDAEPKKKKKNKSSGSMFTDEGAFENIKRGASRLSCLPVRKDPLNYEIQIEYNDAKEIVGTKIFIYGKSGASERAIKNIRFYCRPDVFNTSTFGTSTVVLETEVHRSAPYVTLINEMQLANSKIIKQTPNSYFAVQKIKDGNDSDIKKVMDFMSGYDISPSLDTLSELRTHNNKNLLRQVMMNHKDMAQGYSADHTNKVLAGRNEGAPWQHVMPYHVGSGFDIKWFPRTQMDTYSIPMMQRLRECIFGLFSVPPVAFDARMHGNSSANDIAKMTERIIDAKSAGIVSWFTQLFQIIIRDLLANSIVRDISSATVKAVKNKISPRKVAASFMNRLQVEVSIVNKISLTTEEITTLKEKDILPMKIAQKLLADHLQMKLSDFEEAEIKETMGLLEVPKNVKAIKRAIKQGKYIGRHNEKDIEEAKPTAAGSHGSKKRPADDAEAGPSTKKKKEEKKEKEKEKGKEKEKAKEKTKAAPSSGKGKERAEE